MTRRGRRDPESPWASVALRRGGAVLPGFGLMLFALAVQLRYLAPPYPSDQVNYLQAARVFPDPPTNLDLVHQFARLGLVLPARLAIAAFGYTQAAYYAVPVLTLLLLVPAVYALGYLLFSRAVGVAAVLLVAGNAAVFPGLSMPLPDLLSTALVTSAIALAVAVAQDRPAMSDAGRRRAALVLLGVLLGWSYLVREFTVFLWPLPFLLLLRRTGWRPLGWVAAPIAGLVGAELAVLAAVYGDPLARFRAVSGHGSAPISAELAATFQDLPRHVYATQFWNAIGEGPGGPALQAALVATVVGAVVRPRRFGLLLLWIAALYLPLTLLGGGWDPAHPRLRLQLVRYWFPVFPAFLLGGTGLVWLLTRWGARRIRHRDGSPTAAARWAGAVAAVAVVVAAAVPAAAWYRTWSHDPDYRAGGATQLESFRSWLAANGGSVPRIWADDRTATLVPFFLSGPFGGRVWQGHVAVLRAGRPGPRAGDVVLLYSRRSPLCGHCRQAERRLFGPALAVPSTWSPEWASQDGVAEVYRVR